MFGDKPAYFCTIDFLRILCHKNVVVLAPVATVFTKQKYAKINRKRFNQNKTQQNKSNFTIFTMFFML